MVKVFVQEMSICTNGKIGDLNAHVPNYSKLNKVLSLLLIIISRNIMS